MSKDGVGSFIEGEFAAIGRHVALPGGQNILEAGEKGVRAAVASAKKAFVDKQRFLPTGERIRLLEVAAKIVEEAREELARTISDDVGKPIRSARVEVRRGAELFSGCAAAIGQIGAEALPLDVSEVGQGTVGFVRHIPYGVVAAITPFNAPINLLVQKLAPAIAAGNSVVVKPAPAGLRTTLRLAELLVAAGWPKGAFNVLSGDRETALVLVAHSDVHAVSFTGGTTGGDALARAAGAKKFLAELGSNAANLVFDDADLDKAATKIAGAAFEASGQQCISAQRVIVQRKVLPEFVQRFVNAAMALRVGPARDDKTDVGPMVSDSAAERTMAMFDDGVRQGGRVALQPKRDGRIVSPGILVDVPRNARLWNEEVFGPLAVVVGFDDLDQGLEIANDSEFGLQGAVFTSDLDSAFRCADRFDVGSMWINEASRFRLDTYPFGGVKRSGVGREGVRYAIKEMSQLKFIGIRT